jgi:hypothetical protein
VSSLDDAWRHAPSAFKPPHSKTSKQALPTRFENRHRQLPGRTKQCHHSIGSVPAVGVPEVSPWFGCQDIASGFRPFSCSTSSERRQGCDGRASIPGAYLVAIKSRKQAKHGKCRRFWGTSHTPGVHPGRCPVCSLSAAADPRQHLEATVRPRPATRTCPPRASEGAPRNFSL